MPEYVPVIDAKVRAPLPPISIRYHRAGTAYWAIASINNEDYATPNCASRTCARQLAFNGGYLYKVTAWNKVA